jgi:hypothetical protein
LQNGPGHCTINKERERKRGGREKGKVEETGKRAAIE